MDCDAGRVLGGMNGCVISDLEGLSGAKRLRNASNANRRKQGVEKYNFGSAALPQGR